MNNQLEKLDSNAVTVTGTWDGVRHWLNAAKMFEQGKLFSQVMTGFELMALKKAHGVINGNNQHEGRVSQNGKPSEDWETILQKEAGLAQTTAYRYMDMAKVAAPRLKKLPALKNFDPTATPISQLGNITRTALETAVKKLTDGKTQADFFDELYKGKTGNPNAGEHGQGSRKLTLEEQQQKAKDVALENSGWMGKAITASNNDFFLLASENDVELDAQIAVLEFALTLRRKYRNTPRTRRDTDLVKAIQSLIAKESPLKLS